MKGEPVTHWMGSIDVLGIESPRTFGDCAAPTTRPGRRCAARPCPRSIGGNTPKPHCAARPDGQPEIPAEIEKAI
jgi:hypothetical protein